MNIYLKQHIFKENKKNTKLKINLIKYKKIPTKNTEKEEEQLIYRNVAKRALIHIPIHK